MVLPVFFILLVGISLAVYVWFSSLPDPSIWKAAFLLSIGIGVARLAFTLLGEAILENQSTWLQIPAFMMALSRLPEVALLPEEARSSHLFVGLAIFLGTYAWAFGIAWVAIRVRRSDPAT